MTSESLRIGRYFCEIIAVSATATILLASVSCSRCNSELLPDSEEPAETAAKTPSMPSSQCKDPQWKPSAGSTRFAAATTSFDAQPKVIVRDWAQRNQVQRWLSLERGTVPDEVVEETLNSDECVETAIGVPRRLGLLCRGQPVWLSVSEDCWVTEWRVWALEHGALRLVWAALRNRMPASITVDVLENGATLRVLEVGTWCCHRLYDWPPHPPFEKKDGPFPSGPRPVRATRSDGCAIVGLHKWEDDKFDDREHPLDLLELQRQCGPRLPPKR